MDKGMWVPVPPCLGLTWLATCGLAWRKAASHNGAGEAIPVEFLMPGGPADPESGGGRWGHSDVSELGSTDLVAVAARTYFEFGHSGGDTGRQSTPSKV
ncbi:unnamed protein product [Lasius platythorax]|uniref:Secreted protein n=1 Tax=Lasius platythorax TaxID=488582 RepID=A0AAV2MY91_9HYME